MSDNTEKTSLYIPADLKREVEIHCISLKPKKKKPNDFYLEAIREKLEREGAK